jgi:DNA-binding response OmpR family regulator
MDTTPMEFPQTLHDGIFGNRVGDAGVIFTGRESELDRVGAFRAGVAAFFNKPFDQDEFLVAVGTAFQS